MTDINDPLSEPLDAKRRAGAAAPGNPLRRSDAELLAYAELLFFAYRDFTRDPDAILRDFGFGRAHHRVLHFVTRHSARAPALSDRFRPRLAQASRRAAAHPPRRSAEGRRPGGRYCRPPLPTSDDQCRRTAQSLLHHVLIAGP